MNRFRALKYGMAYSLFLTAIPALLLKGPFTWLPFAYAFVVIPSLELIFRPDPRNLDKAEEEVVRNDRLYDFMIYATIPLLWIALIAFCWTFQHAELAGWERAGLIFSIGTLCGAYGINVGHELGHRKKPFERTLAKISLMGSLYMHFFIEHNRGHHKRVSTHEDPASARRGEMLYAFWFRSIIFSYLSAWNLERERLAKKQSSFWSWDNEMIRFHVIQLGLLAVIAGAIGPLAMAGFIGTAFVGMLLLETVNYIEHYGLTRQELKPGKYERVMPEHSWNSNHIMGRLLLFELSRHSDHHHLASRQYQVLRSIDHAPQMPTGYPGMMVMATVPPIWFRVMHRNIEKYQQVDG
ncbi:alkane 1-monooxygenase [Pontibacter sp. G13]|uniref:alkane 1-monooxygenase n=1 Tax=Pontibacter sp. G13 TaxID=3074898 RepID=UPI002889A0F3|nr:alkane 1-monooxygenase [Pontibacter sp. G13]WNJ16765.1 alkane 1-monooxygenase [Pontibacter sp. G13]